MPTPHKATSAFLTPADRVGQVFVEKYDTLLQWALRLTHGDQEEAKDLLHEAFVQFTLRQLDLTGVENVDGYLYTALKHFHLSTLKRAKRDPLNHISLVEFDSVDLALRSSFGLDQLDVQNDLRRICAFLCWRKASAKSASYLILRFFHGYYPEEIMRVALASRRVVDEGIRLAAAEAKVYLGDPGRLRFMPRRARDKQPDDSAPVVQELPPSLDSVLFAVPAAEFLHTLTQMIFASCAEVCLPREVLLGHYEQALAALEQKPQPPVASIGRTLLAHLVSCQPCLDAVNEFLKMPPLSDRFPGERLGSYRPTGARSGSAVRRAPKGTGLQMQNEQALQEMRLAKDSILKLAQARLRECFEHQPRKLLVAVNGDIVATQDVASDHNKQSILLYHRKTVDFVEVFSEQGIRLAFISVTATPPSGPDTLTQKVLLSAGRSIETVLEFTSSGPRLEVVYTDPLLAASADPLDAELDQSLQLILAPEPATLTASQALRNEGESLFDLLRRQCGAWLESFRPLVISGALVLLVAVSFGLYLMYSRHKAQDATTLLAEAARQESAPIAPGHLVHRVLAFEVTSEDGKQVLQSSTVGIWKGAGAKQLAMRLTSQDGKLQAGVWKVADGSYAVYKDGKLADHAAAPANLGDGLALDDDADLWMSEPAAGRFQKLADSQGAMTAHQDGADSVVEYLSASPQTNTNRPRLVRAALTLRGGGHVVGEVLWIESGGQVRRVSYREVSDTEREGTASDSELFSPERGIAGSHAALNLRRGSPQPSDAAFLAHLNLEAFTLLGTVNADSGEQITVKRTPDHQLSIRGVLASNDRLAQVENALAPLKANPMVQIALSSAEQQALPGKAVSRRKPVPAAVAVESVEINAQAIPAQERLKGYFSRRGHSGKDLDQQIEVFAQETLGHSSRALQQSWTLHTLASSFSLRDWAHMSVPDRKQWIALYLRHSTALQTEAQAIRHSLEVLSLNASGESAESASKPPEDMPQPASEASLNALSDQLLEQSSVADRVLRSALTASTGPPPDMDALCRQLQVSLAHTDRAIREIERRAQDLEVNQPVH